MMKKIKFLNKLRNLPTEQASGLPFTKMEKQNVIAPPAKQQENTSKDTLHLSCKTLSIGSLIEIDVTGDLRWLIINGNPSAEQLLQAWELIIQEYVSIVKTDKANNIFELYKKIKYTEWQILFIDTCLQTLKVEYDADVAERLGNMGFGVVEPHDDRKEYLTGIYAIETAAKMLIVLLNQYQAEYTSIQKSEQANQPITENEDQKRFRYEKELALIGKYQGKRISKTKVTAFEYAAIINNYLEEQEAIKKANKNGRQSGTTI